MDALGLLNEPRRLVCSVHFGKTCFDGVPQVLRDAGYTRRRLRRDAVPTCGVRKPQSAADYDGGQHRTNSQDVPAELRPEEPSTAEPVVDDLETLQSSELSQDVPAELRPEDPSTAEPVIDDIKTLQSSKLLQSRQRRFSAIQQDYSSKQDAEAQTDTDPVSTVKPKAVQVGLGANMYTSRATQTADPPSRATQTAILLEYRSVVRCKAIRSHARTTSQRLKDPRSSAR